MTTKSSKIVVLEDDPRRTKLMRAVSIDSIVDNEIQFFDDAHLFREWLEKNAKDVSLISLDHDLDMTASSGSSDPGTGSDIVDWLIDMDHRQIPIVIHSSNALMAPGMHMRLAMAGWSKITLAPFVSGEDWIANVTRLL